MEHKFRLSKYGTQLWARPRAAEIRPHLTHLLDSANAGDTVVIDFQDVQVFDFSFANEFFGKTIFSLPNEYPGRFLIVENLTTYTLENLVKGLESLNLAIIERKEGKLQLLGKTHSTDITTFNAIVEAKDPVTAANLKEKLGINLTTVNERLSKLTNLGLIRREKSTSISGREQYQYSVLK